MANLKSVLLGSWLGDKLMRDSTVAELVVFGPRFRRVVLEGTRLGAVRCVDRAIARRSDRRLHSL
jgi:hypothetical protein